MRGSTSANRGPDDANLLIRRDSSRLCRCLSVHQIEVNYIYIAPFWSCRSFKLQVCLHPFTLWYDSDPNPNPMKGSTISRDNHSYIQTPRGIIMSMKTSGAEGQPADVLFTGTTTLPTKP